MLEKHHEMMTVYLLYFRLNIILDRWLTTSVLYVMLEIAWLYTATPYISGQQPTNLLCQFVVYSLLILAEYKTEQPNQNCGFHLPRGRSVVLFVILRI